MEGPSAMEKPQKGKYLSPETMLSTGGEAAGGSGRSDHHPADLRTERGFQETLFPVPSPEILSETARKASCLWTS